MKVPPGVTVFCDPTLAPVMASFNQAAARQMVPPLSVLAAPAALMLAQIERHTRNDVLVTLSGAMDQAVHAKLVKPETRIDGFRNQLVLAAVAGKLSQPADRAGLQRLLGVARVAVTDPTVASGLDGRGVLQANGLTPAIGNRISGAANTADVVFLLTSGAADLGLVYLTDVRADQRLQAIAPLIADPSLISYAAAVNAHAMSPDAAEFLRYLQSDDAAARLRHAGLEIAA